MKTSILVVLAVLMIVPITGEAQNYQNPNNVPPYNYYGVTPSNNKAYRGKIDTLTQVKLGAANQLSFVVHSSDTMKTDILVDYLQRERTTWTQVYADSFIAVKDTSFEYVLRSPTVDRISGFARTLRLRLSHHPAGSNPTPSDFDSTTTYTLQWIWKP